MPDDAKVPERMASVWSRGIEIGSHDGQYQAGDRCEGQQDSSTQNWTIGEIFEGRGQRDPQVVG